jgi:hypothetical protein
MSTPFKFHTAQSLLKRTGLFVTIAIAFSSINVRPIQAQLSSFTRPPKAKLASNAEITFVQAQLRTASKETVSVEAVCPTATTTIGGGGEVSPADVNAYLKTSNPNPRASVPEPYTRVWRITGINLTGKPVTFSVYAICAQVRDTPIGFPLYK